MKTLKMAVVGVGAMGQNHARVLSDTPHVELTAIVDASVERATSVGERFKVPYYTSVAELTSNHRLDAVIVSCPTVYHCSTAVELMSQGIHVLVEKPISFTLNEAQDMIACAEASGVLLGVGHIERYNPAILELKKRIDRGDLGKIFMIHSRRQSPLPRRIVDVGVGMDLATHELDMMRFLTNSDVSHISAEVSQVTKAKAREDIIFALLRFNSEVLGILDVNWVTPTQVREISVTGEKGMFSVNYHSQEICFFENEATPNFEQIENWDTEREFCVVAGNMTRFQIAKREPLRLELEAFTTAVLSGDKVAPCTGHDGYHALKLALEIVTSGHASRIVTP